jgi:hypothetical protein
MSLQEKFDSETDWRRKALIVELFHSMMLLKHGDAWNIKRTATILHKSVGLISENINIARAIKLGLLETCDSRNKALKIMRGK